MVVQFISILTEEQEEEDVVVEEAEAVEAAVSVETQEAEVATMDRSLWLGLASVPLQEEQEQEENTLPMAESTPERRFPCQVSR